MTHSGTLRKRIAIQSETSVSDNAGGYTLGWATSFTLWADITPVTGHSLYVYGHIESHVTHRITVRYQSGITADMRVLYNGRVFAIHAVVNDDESNHWLHLLVEEGVAT